ncbi:MAG: glycosyltransferase [Verrucomicrobiota bacterium]
MNVLHLITELDVGGAERQLVALAPRFNRSRWNVTVAYFHGSGHLRPELEEDGIAVTKLDSRHKGDLGALVRLVRLLREQRIDILHTHLIQADLLGLLAAQLTRVPVTISTKHSVDYFTRQGRWLTKVDTFANRHFTRLVAVSESVKNHYIKTQHLPPAKIEVIYNGIDIAGLECAPPISRTELGVAPDTKIICAVGTLSERKGQSFLLEAWPTVLTRHPSSVLVFVGDGPLQASLEATAKSAGLHDSVRFLGRRSDVPAILHAADLFVLPSQTEGFGLAMVEAMAASVPVIATTVGGVPELARHEHEALLISPRNAPALAGAINTLLDDPGRATALATAARQRVEQFSIQHTVRRLESCYESLLAPAANAQT